MKTLLICRFSGSVGWFAAVKDLYNVVILQKYTGHEIRPEILVGSREIQKFVFEKVVEKGRLQQYLDETPPGQYPNIGLDAHVFFSYICDNYDSLSDFIIFAHENPRHHCEYFTRELRALADDIDYTEFGTPFICNQFGDPEQKETPVGELYEKIFNQPSPEKFIFVSGSLFAVSKKNILNHNLLFYQNCRDLTLTDWRYPWAFERLYRLIFADEKSIQILEHQAEINKLDKSQYFIFYDKQFFKHTIYNTNPSSQLMEDFNSDKHLPKLDREYFKSEYSKFFK